MVKQVKPAACDCEVRGLGAKARRAVAVDEDIKRANLTRLRRIEGQIRGLAAMIEEERYCADIITQVSAVQEALRSVSRNLLKNHLRHCASTAIRAGEHEAEQMYEELLALIFKGAR